MKRRRKWVRVALVVAVLALVFMAGAWFGDRKLKDLGHPGLGRFVHQLAVNYPESFKSEPLELRIKVNDRDLEHIQKVVDDARERGVIIPEGNEYVSAEITTADGEFKARIRIKGKLTDHVSGSKWSFRVIAKKDGGFLGMRRFSLQHPGTRNYLYDWFHHELMKGEGIIALRFGFIKVYFNDEDLGIYNYEEHFGPELLHNNDRLAGPIFRFDPGLFWEHRLNMMRRLRIDGAYGDYQAATIDAFGSGSMVDDTVLMGQFEEAVGLVDGFRRGDLTASQVFDVDRVAIRHAILDLIGGHHSMDFSDIKFYYDPVAKRVEPVAYESFSAFPIRQLAGSWRYVGRQDASQEVHDAWFNDPELFRRYVHHLERFSDPHYLDSAFTALGPALDSASAIIYAEFPWKEMDRSIYTNNQRVIRRLLDVPKGFHAHAQVRRGDTLDVLIVPLEALPMEIHSLRGADGSAIPPLKEAIIPARAEGQMGGPQLLSFAGTSHLEEHELMIEYSVLGASVRKQLEVFPFAMLDGPSLVAAMPVATDLRQLPWFIVDDDNKRVLFRQGDHVIDRDIVIPAGMVLVGEAPLSIELRDGARIHSNSPVNFKGRADDPVRIRSTGDPRTGISILHAKGRSEWSHVELEWAGDSAAGPAILTMQETAIDVRDCRLGGVPGRDLIQLVRTDATLNDVLLAGGKDQIQSSYSTISMVRVTAHTAKDDAVVIRGGTATLRNVTIDRAMGSGIKALAAAVVEVHGSRIENARRGIEVSEGTRFTMQGGRIEATETGLHVKKRSMRHGPSSVSLSKVDVVSQGGKYKTGEGNEVSLDDAPVQGTSQAH